MSDGPLANIGQEAEQTQEQDINVDAASENNSEAKEPEKKLLAGKFEDAEQLEKGYKELSAKLREKNPEPPEEYNLTTEGLEGFEDVNINVDDERVQHFTGVFKDLGLSNEQASRLTAEFAKLEAAEAIDQKAELDKLGPNGESMIKEVESFFNKNIKSFGLTDEEVAELGNATATAEGVTALHKIAKWAETRNNIPEAGAKPTQEIDINALKKEAQELSNHPSISFDKDKQARHQEIWRQIANARQ